MIFKIVKCQIIECGGKGEEGDGREGRRVQYYLSLEPSRNFHKE
jgi:hypothetical protein